MALDLTLACNPLLQERIRKLSEQQLKALILSRGLSEAVLRSLNDGRWKYQQSLEGREDDFCVQLMTNMTTFCRTSKILDCCHRNMEFAFLHGCWCSDAAVEKGGLELQAHKWFIENKECEDASAPTADDWMLEEYCLSWGEEPS
eukprot:gene27809-34346_t